MNKCYKNKDAQKPHIHEEGFHTYPSGHFYIFKAESIPFVEHEKHQSLEEGHLELFLPLSKENRHIMCEAMFAQLEKFRRLLLVLKLWGWVKNY